ncbi:MAG: hypothetical protein COA78_34655 [Blastopirellula sp.]|nr:MAG: hypothetical protein COA78_34655 [Blastopirellula sp.]
MLILQRGIGDWNIGGNPVTIYELLCLLFTVGFVIIGTKTARWTLTVSGLIGLAVFVFRVTDIHFKDFLPWPLLLAVSEGLAMLAGITSVIIRERIQHRKT